MKVSRFVLSLSFILSFQLIFAQSFLQVDGKDIVTEDGNSYILRGMGLGGWMVQEGYMLQTASFANPQYQIKEKIKEVVGQAGMKAFYDGWLDNHVTKADIDALKSWGFNSVRLPMHYNLYTLPIEEEPISGNQTWLEKGFELTDRLIQWCAENEMYVILDLHAAPGGQGYDEGISDYDPSKPSLWESEANQDKTVALWKRLAERYKDEKWVGGYDLINETNWQLPGGTALANLHKRITTAIREVDNNHIIFIEGNWFANDFTGLTPPWDDNMVYSPHKYWSTNDDASIQWVLDMREQYNVPLYLGESGENSNVWFRDAIELLESHNIGWAWWPLKKIDSVVGPLTVKKTTGYQELLDYWSGNGPKPSVAKATASLNELVEMLKFENCDFHPDVIDAMFRQVYDDKTLPFAENKIPGVIYATDFDLGTNNHAYYDLESGNYQVSTGNFTSWNNGWVYRNDGVDIEPSEDVAYTNKFNVGWADAGEWMKYTVDIEESGRYKLEARVAGGGNGGKLRISVDGADAISDISVPNSGGYQEWTTLVISDLVLSQFDKSIKIHIDNPGFNIGSYRFVKSGTPNSVPLTFSSGESENSNTILFSVNKPTKANDIYNIEDFTLRLNGNSVGISEITIDPTTNRRFVIEVEEDMNFLDVITLSYDGEDISSTDGTLLETFTNEPIQNRFPKLFVLPTKIEAEDYFFHQGIQLENCMDNGGGQNIGYLDNGDYAEYGVSIPESGLYQVSFRTAAMSEMGQVRLSCLLSCTIYKVKKLMSSTLDQLMK